MAITLVAIYGIKPLWINTPRQPFPNQSATVMAYNYGMSQQDMIAGVREKFAVLDTVLDERSRRLWAATEAKAIGHGGQSVVAKATGLSRRTIYQGLRELEYFCDDRKKSRPAGSESGWGSQAPFTSRSDVGGGFGSLGRAHQPWRPAIATTLDVQECAATGSGTAKARTQGWAAEGG